MTDTIQKIADEVATYQAPSNGQYIQVHPKVMRDWEARLRALSASASAGEGGDLATALRKWQAVLRGDAECAGLNNGYRNACEHHAAHIDTLLTAAPQPAQAGDSGGGDGAGVPFCPCCGAHPDAVSKWKRLSFGRFEGLASFDVGGKTLRLLYDEAFIVDDILARVIADFTTPASPATEQGGVSVESVRRALASYHLQFTEHDEDGPQSLFDALTPPGDVDIGRGIKELGLLADYVAAELSTPQPAAAQGCDAGAIREAIRRAKTLEEAVANVAALAAAPQPQADECPACKLGQATCGYHARNPTTPPAHGDGEYLLVHVGDALSHAFPEDIAEWKRVCRIVYPFLRERLTTRPTPEAQEARDAVQWAHDEFEDKEHVARVRGDIGLADYYGLCKAKMAAALALPAQGEGKNGY